MPVEPEPLTDSVILAVLRQWHVGNIDIADMPPELLGDMLERLLARLEASVPARRPKRSPAAKAAALARVYVDTGWPQAKARALAAKVYGVTTDAVRRPDNRAKRTGRK